MSWESTTSYYRLINRAVQARLGGYHSARIILYSVDFQEIETLQRSGDWQGACAMLADAARTLESAGVDALVLCTNTMHKVAATIEDAVRVPLLHIVDATAEEIRKSGFTRVGLIGTRFTMEEAFYKGRLRDRYGLAVIVPARPEREIVDRIIFGELCLGRITDGSRSEYRRIMESLIEQGAQAIILGCTEISLLVGQTDSAVPLFDTTTIHAHRAVEWALERE